MDLTCSKHERYEKVIQIYGLEEKQVDETFVQIYLKQTNFEDAECIELTQVGSNEASGSNLRESLNPQILLRYSFP